MTDCALTPGAIVNPVSLAVRKALPETGGVPEPVTTVALDPAAKLMARLGSATKTWWHQGSQWQRDVAEIGWERRAAL